jgi:hypothetical protein
LESATIFGLFLWECCNPDTASGLRNISAAKEGNSEQIIERTNDLLLLRRPVITQSGHVSELR